MIDIVKGNRVKLAKKHYHTAPFNQLSLFEKFFGLKIKEVGNGAPGREDFMVPVQFSNGGYGIISQTFGLSRFIHVSDNPIVSDAIWNARDMPILTQGIGSDVIHVEVPGQGLVRIYYNSKKYEYGYMDTFKPVA